MRRSNGAGKTGQAVGGEREELRKTMVKGQENGSKLRRRGKGGDGEMEEEAAES